MISLLRKLYPLRLAPVSPDMDKCADILLRELPFIIHEYPSSSELNGWIVPHSWSVKKALIRKGGKLIYDGKKHPLGVMGYAKSFNGVVSLQKLREHLTYRKDSPSAIGYHCDYFYKPWRADWGFSVPYNLYKGLENGNYEVTLECEFLKSRMKVLDYLLPGESEATVFLNAHNCHAGQANDDISGIVAAIEVIKELKKRKNRRYSYRVIIAPEHLGTVFYLSEMDKEVKKNFRCGIFLEMLGNDNSFALQESFTGEDLIDKAAHLYLKHNCNGYRWDKFRKVVGNDETVWESPGYEIPCISLSRAPYPEYHTNLDNDKIISIKRLEGAVGATLGIVDIIETNTAMKRKFKGLIALSNPKYDLYMPMADPSIRPTISENERNWNYLMDCLPRYFDGDNTIVDIALKHNLDYFALYRYICKFEEKGLVSFTSGKGKRR